jgi:transducin (beta)-like 1
LARPLSSPFAATIVWDVSGSSGQVVQQFNDHAAPALDVDWKDDTTFASCSTDKRVLICRVGVDHPLRIYTGHLDEVNAVKWDPSGTLLASCSDDFTAKVWNVASDRSEPMYDFKDHKAEIYTLKWYVDCLGFVLCLCFTVHFVLFVNQTHKQIIGVQRVLVQ